MAKIKVKLEDWINYLESQVNKTLYVWGANDELCVNLLNKLMEMEKSDHTEKEALDNIDRILTLLQKRLLEGCDILKLHCADCSGLAVGFLMAKGILKSDTNAAGLCNKIEQKVSIADVKAGDFLFYENLKHVGYAVSNKWAVESKNHDVGVVKTRIADRPWKIAKRPDWYEESEPVKPVLKREIYYTNPMMTGDDVKEVQEKLNEAGYNCGLVDGYFGKKCDIATRNFQSDKGLTPDGIIGKRTAIALGFDWEG